MTDQPQGSAASEAYAESRAARTDLRALLGEAIWLAAVDHGMTQADLSDALGMSTKHVNQAVNGKAGSPEFFDRVAALFDMTWEVRLV